MTFPEWTRWIALALLVGSLAMIGFVALKMPSRFDQ